MQIETDLNSFVIEGKLGEGAFAEVWKVKRHQDGQTYALKKIKIGQMKQKERENALTEIRLLASLNDEHIIAYKEAFIDKNSSTLCILMEYASGGDLLKMVQTHLKRRARIPEETIWKAAAHISMALKTLHEKRVLHRDLKCANVFIAEGETFKLGDLNVSKVLKKQMAETQTGTPYYASPQVWKDKPYGPKSDIWSLGCLLYEMAASRPPFTATDLKSLYKKVCNGVFQRIPGDYSNDLSHFISSLLRLEPNERPTAEELLSNAALHRHYKGELPHQSKQVQDYDPLLQTLKVNLKNLKEINQILPKANYDGSRSNRSRAASRGRASQADNKIPQIENKTPQIVKKIPQIYNQVLVIAETTEQSIERNDSLVNVRVKKQQPLNQIKEEQKLIQRINLQNNDQIFLYKPNNLHRKILLPKISQQRSVKVIQNYLDIRKRVLQKERAQEIERLKEEKQSLIVKRERILSACAHRNNVQSPSLPRKKKPTFLNNNSDVRIRSSKGSRKNIAVRLPMKLPPKPINNNASYVQKGYKLPPRPSIATPSKSKGNISVFREEIIEQRQNSKQNLRRAGEIVLSGTPEIRVIKRSGSARKVVYPNWWID